MAYLTTVSLHRRDSLSKLQSLRHRDHTSGSELAEPLEPLTPPFPTNTDRKFRRISEEEGKRILFQAARKRSLPSPTELSQSPYLPKSADDTHQHLTCSRPTSLPSATETKPLAIGTAGIFVRTQQTATSSMSTASRPVALLVASLGNPAPYHSTRHSAGHLVLKNLQSQRSLPLLNKSKVYGGGYISLGSEVGRPEFTLWQSPSLMNVSGVALLKAWKQFVAVQKASPLDPITGLVILHDELEVESGRLKVRRGPTSAKGHNGIKSVQSSLQGGGLMDGLGERFVKIGIGIGRPSGGSRETRDVSAYVLGQLTSREKDGLADAAGELENLLYQEMGRMGSN